MSTNRELGDRDEQRIARKFGGTVVSGSGSSAEKKGDLRLGKFLVQAKCTSGGSISVKRRDLDAIQRQALNCAIRPAFFLTYYSGETVEAEWVAFPTWLLSELGIDLRNNCP